MQRLPPLVLRLPTRYPYPPSLLRSRQYRPALEYSHHQQRHRMSPRPPIKYPCYETKAAITKGFSCRWDDMKSPTFLRVLPDFKELTPIEFEFHRAFKQPKTETTRIELLAFADDVIDPHVVFEANAKYYYYDGTNGDLYEYSKGLFIDIDDLLLHFMERLDDAVKLPAPTEDEYLKMTVDLGEEKPRP
ncbi:hypothetical protein C8R46DRAFT_484850 [Mycena filopes]|nr:hypothetical protein C8R46DRAFT_484850 [Mycena filopes]